MERVSDPNVRPETWTAAGGQLFPLPAPALQSYRCTPTTTTRTGGCCEVKGGAWMGGEGVYLGVAVMSCHAGSHSSSTVHLRGCSDEFMFRDDTHGRVRRRPTHTHTTKRSARGRARHKCFLWQLKLRGPHKLWEPPRGGHTDPWWEFIDIKNRRWQQWSCRVCQISTVAWDDERRCRQLLRLWERRDPGDNSSSAAVTRSGFVEKGWRRVN